ncbi:MAG: radical SAM protein [Pseudomonadota bacterium]|nr:radical SAM protein [Pseudomonadota bacterium]
MDCGSCGTRPDRPHTFLAHAPDVCPSCTTPVEARVVLRDGKAVHLIRCKQCGHSERVIAEDGAAWRAAFVASGRPDDPVPHRFKQTTSTCANCLALVPTDVMVAEGKVFFEKICSRCGPSRALVSEDASHYVRAYAFAAAGTQPFMYTTKAEKGCPTDCGLCNEHEQHTCLPIIEITDHCNLECPVCIVNNQYSTHMAPDAFRRIVEGLVEREGQLESIALSGGEPTSHPNLLELLDIADRPEIARIVLITNGVRLGKDRKLAEELKRRGTYIGLQMDGFDAATHKALRGRDLGKEKEAALTMIRELDLPTQMIAVIARGINDNQVGQLIDLFEATDAIISLNFQPASYSGFGGGTMIHDPLDRVTISGVIQRAEEQTNGRLLRSDFYPLPCSHPQCVSLTYLLKLDDGRCVPFPRFVNFEKHLNLLRSSAVLPSTRDVEDSLQDTLYEVFAHQDEIPDGPAILAALKRSLQAMFPGRSLTWKEASRIGERQAKTIFLHHYMDRHDFDLERLRKCCHHYPQEDGRVMPACGFNLFHRGTAKGPDTPKAEWARPAPHAGLAPTAGKP